MHRRDFLRTSATLMASAVLPAVASAAAPQPTYGRMVLPINRGWRYAPSRIAGSESFTFDDSAFEPVVLPHTNINLPWHSFTEKDYTFISTYRRRLRLPPATQGKRIFLDFEGAMTATTVFLNGISLGEYRGGFTPFSFELTDHLRSDGYNTLVVHLDSTERPDIPPFGNEIDYLTFGGIYREVAIRVVPSVYLDNIFAHVTDVLTDKQALHVDCFLAGDSTLRHLSLEVELLAADRILKRSTQPVGPQSSSQNASEIDPPATAPTHESTEITTDPRKQTVTLRDLGPVKLWELSNPNLYTVRVRLMHAGKPMDEDSRRIGFREAIFTDQGFSLNGNIVKLRGLDRHQTFPFVGQAMPARVQRRDADILRHGLHCNIVRASHYPQSRHFLDRCDEIGLLVLEEIPGWQHIGPEPWKQLSIDNVGRMIRRDWNHPSVILWGVRINESPDDHGFYTRTNALAHALDPSRQTGGIRNFAGSEFLEDVFTINDFGFPLRKPNHPRYLNTEFVGHTFPTKTTDDDERQREHTLRHARIHNQLASDPQYAGGIGWCAFDYNTHANFGAGDRICYHGVMDIFREPKAAAGFYQSQCDPAEEVVLEPAFHWANSDESTAFNLALICSNCDHIKVFTRENSDPANPWKLVAELAPNRAEFPNLKYGPFLLDRTTIPKENRHGWGDLRLDGFINGQQAITRSFSGLGVDQKFALLPDDQTLVSDGADSTRVVLRVTDEFGAIRPFANDPILLKLEGPARLIGDNPFGLIGGTGAVWVRAGEQPGPVRLTATHPRLGTQTVQLTITASTPEIT